MSMPAETPAAVITLPSCDEALLDDLDVRLRAQLVRATPSASSPGGPPGSPPAQDERAGADRGYPLAALALRAGRSRSAPRCRPPSRAEAARARAAHRAAGSSRTSGPARRRRPFAQRTGSRRLRHGDHLPVLIDVLGEHAEAPRTARRSRAPPRRGTAGCRSSFVMRALPSACDAHQLGAVAAAAQRGEAPAHERDQPEVAAHRRALRSAGRLLDSPGAGRRAPPARCAGRR